MHTNRVPPKSRMDAILQIMKEANPCSDCANYYPHYCMDYDHLDAKEKKHEISRMKNGFTLQQIQDEINKCQLVCSNCHRARTYQRWNKNRYLLDVRTLEGSRKSRPNVIPFLDTSLEQLPQGIYYDQAVTALAIRVGKLRKTFIILQNGIKQSIGLYPRMTITQAREEARRRKANYKVSSCAPSSQTS